MVLLVEPIHDFAVIRGDGLQIAVIWNGADNGQPVDMTGFEGELVVRDDEGFELLALDSNRVLLGADGTAVVVIGGDETAGFAPEIATPGAPPVRCHYQLRVTEGGGEPVTILKGTIIVSYSAIEG